MSGILPDITVTSATRFNAAVLNCTNPAPDKCNCDVYISWINAQLSENYPSNNNNNIGQPSLLHCQRYASGILASTATPVPVKDLSRDLRNGVVLARLAEKLSGEHLEKVHPHPVTRQQMLTNVDEVLKFALRWRVKMHPVLSTEIVDGDTRATLRLVLALAAHFRPGSVIRQIGGANIHSNGSPTKTPPASQRVFNFNTTSDTYMSPSPPVNGSVSPSFLSRQDPQQLFSAKLLKFKAVRSPRTTVSTSTGIFSSPIENNLSNNRPSSAQYEDENDECSNSREDSQISSPLSHEAQAGSNGATSVSSLESSKPAIIDEQDVAGLQTEIATAKKTLLILQQLLFEQDSVSDGSITDSSAVNGGGVSVNGNNNNQKPVNGHVHDSATVLQLRAQICEMNLTLEELAVEKGQLECRLIDRDRQLADMQATLNERDRLVAHLQAKVHDLIASNRREVAELKELAAATSPSTENVAFLSPFGGIKKHQNYLNNNNNNSNHLNNNVSSSENGDNELSSNQSVEDGPVRGNKTGAVFSGCRIYYYGNDGAGPYCLFASKPLESLCLRDVRQAFSRCGRRYRFRFIPLHELERRRALFNSSKPIGIGKFPIGTSIDPALATLELRNDDDPLPGCDNQVYCRLEEVI